MFRLRTRGIPAGLMATGLLILTGCLPGASGTHEDTFQVGSAPVLIVENDNGEVRVASGQPGTVEVVAAIRFPDNADYSATQSGDTITVEAKVVNPFRSDARADIAITVPPETSVTITADNGLVFVQGLRASITVSADRGHIGLTDVEGPVQASTGSGRISVGRAVGSFNLSSDNGDIVFKGALSPGSASSFNTGNGPIAVEFDGPPDVALDAGSRSGRVKSDLAMSAIARSDKDRLIATIGNGAADLLIRADNGDITIR